MPNHFVVRHASNVAMRAVGASFPAIKNGTAGAPARSELDAAHIMENALNADRYAVWASPLSSPSTLSVDIDLGQPFTISHAGILGFRKRGVLPTALTYLVQPSADTVYTPANFVVAGTSTTSSTNGERDIVDTLTTPVTTQFVRFSWSFASTGMVIGKFFLANVIAGTSSTSDDLDSQGSPGTEVTEKMGRLRNRLLSGAPVQTTVGDPSVLARIPFNNIKQNTLTKLLRLNRETYPFVWIDRLGRARECVLAGDGVTYSQVWGAPDLFNATLELESLG